MQLAFKKSYSLSTNAIFFKIPLSRTDFKRITLGKRELFSPLKFQDFEPEAVCGAGGRPRDDQAVLPRGRHRAQDELRQQV